MKITADYTSWSTILVKTGNAPREDSEKGRLSSGGLSYFSI